MGSMKKVAEAEEHIRLAEKAMKTGFLKRTPDYDTAGDEYSRAATAFKVAGERSKAVESLDKACECFKEMRSLFQAARMLEQATIISRDMSKLDKVVEYSERGALLYRQDGANEAAAQLLEKGAKIVETSEPEKAVGLYLKAFETVGVEERPREAMEFMAKAARLQVRCKKFDEAVGTLRQTLELQKVVGGGHGAAGRSAAGLVIVQLMREDSVAASKAYNEYGGYCDSDTGPALRSLLTAFDEEDADAAKEAINSSAIKNLDIDFARLAKKIPLPDSDGLEAAAAKLGAARLAASEAEKAEATVDAQTNDEDGDLL